MKKTMYLSKLSNVNILTIGDIMLDCYEYGIIDRISPEAPVPIFKPTHKKNMLGGVGNVAANLICLGCSVHLFSRIGQDNDGELITQISNSMGIKTNLMRQINTPTTIKKRLIANNNHILRIDNEIIHPIDAKSFSIITNSCTNILNHIDIAILSDYAKGLLSEKLCKTIISKCRKQNIKVIVDPKGSDYSKYSGAFLIKPNLKELSQATGKVFDTSSPSFLDDVTINARLLAKKIKVGNILVTLSEYGMLYVPASHLKKPLHLPTKAKEVFDVSGAGDTVIATLGAALGAGFDIADAMLIANTAASIVVSKLGTATTSINEIALLLSKSSDSTCDRKITSIGTLKNIVKTLRNKGKIIGFTNGCFDCCHLGHLSSLQEAKSLCDVLIVGVNSDKWIKKHKGADRPIQNQETRTKLLASLEYVDYVLTFDENTALPLVKQIRPDIIAKEGYTLNNWPEGQFVRDIGGKAIVLKRIPGYSTTEIISKLKGDI